MGTKFEDTNYELTCQVAEKGGISVYGLGRFPVTLYREQWQALAEAAPGVVAFACEPANVKECDKRSAANKKATKKTAAKDSGRHVL
jgi:hypothetical protein